MDICIVLFVLLLVPCSTMSEDIIIDLTSEESIKNITSPNYPDHYYNNLYIVWQVIAPTGFRVMVQFNDFDLEEGSWWKGGDSLTVYHGLTSLFEDATQRASLSGFSLPDNISSIGSYLWLGFYSDRSQTEKGFSLSVRAVEPDWACDFKEDTCGLIINEGSWTIGEQGNYYYIEADENMASFQIPHDFTSEEGSLSFGLYQESTLFGDVSVTVAVCKTRDPSSFSIPYDRVVYEYIPYSCSGIQDIEVKFTESGSQFTPIRVFDIQLYEISGPSTASPSTVGMQTTPLPSILPGSPPADKSTQGSVTPETTTPDSVSKQSTDTKFVPSASTSSGISTKNPTNPTSVTPSEGQASNAPPSPGTEGPTIPRTNNKASTLTPTTPTVTLPAAEELGGGSKSSLIPALSSTIVLILITMVIITVFVFMRRRSRDPKVTEPVDEDDDDPNLYNNPVYCSKDDGLPVPDLIVSTNSHISSSSQARQPLNDIDNQYEECEGDRHPVTNADSYLSHHDALSDTHSLPQKDLQNGGKQGQLDGPAVLDDEEEYNALTFNQSSDITRALKKPTSGGEGVNNGYGVLDLPEQEDSKLSDNSPQLHAGPGPKTGPYERDQPGDESEYHGYQDPSEMNQDGSARTPTELDVFSSDKYNILNSGKEVGDYHVYQATDDTGVDEGNYEDLDAKMSREDEYSEIGQSQNHAPGTTDKAPFEPIYSDEVYSEFQ